MLTWTQMQVKSQRLAKNSNSDVLTQLSEDMNTGYHMFNAKLARYYSRKQQFTDLIASQSIYQVPVDCVRILGMTTIVTQVYEPPVSQVRDEEEWRSITSVKSFKTNWPTNYFMIGNDEFQLWPTPSQTITNGIRFYYQPQDHDLSLQDTTSDSTSQTVTVTNGSVLVTASGTAFSSDMASLEFQVTGQTDLTWYEISSATSSTLTLKTPYVGPSGSLKPWRIGQLPIIPQEYQDAPIHYALGNYFTSEGNENRATEHMGIYNNMITQCLEDYSSSSESSVIDDQNTYLNLWQVPPPAA